ncbi:hypothetical protein H0A36_23145 [Endozoicomonas sp. SM1973]|uniref:Uncharacterized protein n=1 Tax=Spartinivicinus marinus TaxID=2994442 RepID=A0A853I4U2_9GAMM|nr:hypothetical protein [Spartinivicinus marinus]MCX4025347.1 hypothetical protein [Spartinivicinus marinus]NYZ68920.1 hypothetical protein [Spartinivicinus marinus]
MRKETLWAVLIVTTVVTVGVAGVGWNSWKDHLHSTALQSPENNSSIREDSLSSQMAEPVKHSQSVSSKQDERDSSQTREKADHTTNSVQESAQALQPSTNQPTLQRTEKQDSLSAATKNQRTRIIVKDPVVLDSIDVMAELKGKELSAEDAIKVVDEES